MGEWICELLFVSLYIMADVLYAMGMRKLIREWYKGKVYDVIKEEHFISRKITYEIINCRVNAGFVCPHIMIDIKVRGYWCKAKYGMKWGRYSKKPLRDMIKRINSNIRRIIIEDKIKEIGMFGFDGRDYNICIGYYYLRPI